MHETFEHTADLGLRIRAADLNTLFAEAGLALFSAIVEEPAAIQPRQRIDIKLEGSEPEYLLFDWLRELLFRFDTEHLLLGRFECKVQEERGQRPGARDQERKILLAGLAGSAWGEPLDEKRHALAHEVKAITYHGLRVERQADGWMAEVIVDI
jgi:SHS2 domain-containing protein